MDARLNNCSLLIGSTIVFFIFSILFFAIICFILGFALSPLPLYLAIGASLFFMWLGIQLYSERQKIRVFVILLILVALIILLCVYISGEFYDLSWDGQFYHQEAVIRLREGWNPFYQQLMPELHASQKLNTYPKAPWICAASVYALTGHIEQAKAFNLLLIFASLFLSWGALFSLGWLRPVTALALSVLFAFNPVSMYQALSFYVDGQLSSLLVCLVSLSYLFMIRDDRVIASVLSMVMIIAINVKQSGLAYISIFAAGAVGLLFIYKRGFLGLRLAKIFLLSSLAGFFIAGYNPYVTNILLHRDPFYPVLSSQENNVIARQMPANLQAMNHFERLSASAFSESANIMAPQVAKLKWPFTFSIDELRFFVCPDVRVGGFGPLFGGAIIVTLLMVVVSLILRLPDSGIAICAIALVLVSSLINPHAWWARYVPQLWMVPIMAILWSFYSKERSLSRLGILLSFILFLNVVLISFFYGYGTSFYSHHFKAQLDYMASLHRPVYVKFFSFKSNRIRLAKRGIRYRETEELPCRDCFELVGFLGRTPQVCIEDK